MCRGEFYRKRGPGDCGPEREFPDFSLDVLFTIHSRLGKSLRDPFLGLQREKVGPNTLY